MEWNDDLKYLLDLLTRQYRDPIIARNVAERAGLQTRYLNIADPDSVWTAILTQSWDTPNGLESLAREAQKDFPDIDFESAARRVRGNAAANNGKTAGSEPSEIRNSLKIEYVNSLVSSQELIDSGIIYSPYKRYYDPTSPRDMSIVKFYLWLPYVSMFQTLEERDRVPFSVICDAGIQVVERAGLDHEWLRKEFYPHSPAKLKEWKLEQFLKLMGEHLQETFLLSIMVPEILLGRKEETPKPAMLYRPLLDLVLLPLVVTHFRRKFKNIYVYRELAGERNQGIDSKISTFIKRITRIGFPHNENAETIISKSDIEYFYIYSAKILAHASHKFYNDDDKTIVNQLMDVLSGNS